MVSPEEIAAVGITNQRETTVVWDRKTGTPVGKAIVWQDRRTADFCEHLQLQGKAPLFYEKTGLVLDAYFSGTKIRWILNSKSEIRTAAEKGTLAFGTIDSWLIWKLTQGKFMLPMLLMPVEHCFLIFIPKNGTTNSGLARSS